MLAQTPLPTVSNYKINPYLFSKLINHNYMKSLLLLVTTLFLLQNLTAQINTKYNKAIYVEVGGLGYNTSLNYDMRFIKGKKGGLGFRLGAGYTQVKTNGLLTYFNALLYP
jgi:hypothetical protein